MSNVVFSSQHSSFRSAKFSKDGAPVTPEFDFVVVGGGPSGCALAARLAQDGKFSVLLLEEGVTVDQNPELRNCVNAPLQTRSLHFSQFDAQYRSAPEEPFTGREIDINSGRVLGGSSCINWAIWTRGPKDDYDLFADLVDNPEFSWEKIVPVYDQIEKRSKDSQNPISVRAISQTPRTPRWSSVAEQSYKQAGFAKYDDVNGGPMLGYTELVENVDDKGTRASANGYFGATVDPAKTRLEIWTGLRVSKILFSSGEQTPRAIGVQTSAGAVHAKREVILTAGAIQSAYLLLLSGIGPAAHLAEHGVPLVVDSPTVGQQMWEHPFMDLSFRLKEEYRTDTVEDLSSVRTAGRHLHTWAREGKGMMSGLPYEWIAFTNAQREIEALLKDDASASPIERATLLRAATPHFENFLTYGHGLTTAPDPLESSYMSITTVLLRPKSRGSVSLAPATAKSGAAPAVKIVLNQLKDKVDQELMLQALERAFDILQADAWTEHLEPRPRPDRDGLLELIKKDLRTMWHFGGTVPMSTKFGAGALDNRFRVLGVAGLRVADTGAVPFPVACHTQAIAYALGEQAARFIGRDYASVVV